MGVTPRQPLPVQPRTLRFTVAAVVLIGLIASSLALGATNASATNVAIWGDNHLIYGSCCGGATLDGTRAYISVSSISPASSSCVLFDSVVSSADSNRQLEAGLAKCGTNANLDGTCSLTNNLVKYVERIPAVGSPVCYPHGAGGLNNSDLVTVDSASGNGTYNAYIDGNLYEGQSGYTSNVGIFEWGENSGLSLSCSGWGGSASFTTWQRYYFTANTWTTVQSANKESTNNCWTVGTVSNGFFTVSH
jgi:hypothetical protein